MAVFHDVFHVSLLRKCVRPGEHVIAEPTPDLQENLTIWGRPTHIICSKVNTVGQRQVQMIQVEWDCEGKQEVTWEPETVMKERFSKWFEKQPRQTSKKDKPRRGTDSRTNLHISGGEL
ncbi:hypothetical protein V5N11_032549 [Cardamine amara subsp. amara]|uniref:Chromo domain-containing protein n=1 Tax=Cardamine amara subsp. amara TaxID=228776 RepID=A0ABD0ZD76_CARAN